MEKMKHVQEPWAIDNAPRSFIITANRGTYDVAVVRDIGNEDNAANAARIVACVNLLAGITNEELAVLAEAGGLEKALIAGKEARTQRDQLAKALSELLEITCDSFGVAGYHLNGNVAEWDEFQEIENARAALAKVQS